MICPKCFNTNNDTANNCAYCGNVLKSDVSVAPQQAVTPAPQPVEAPVQQAPQQPMSNDPFMNQVLMQQNAPKQPSKIDVNKILDKGKELLKNKYVLIGCGVVAVGLVGLVLYNIFHEPSAEELMKAHPSYAEAFFFQGDNNKYALVSKEGKLLTDFEFDYGFYSFTNGYTEISKDNKYGIIKDNGKMSVNYDKYKYITSIGGLYLATGDEDGRYITGSGSTVVTAEDYLPRSEANNAYITTLENNGNLLVYNYKGKKMLTVKDDKDLFMHDKDVYANIYANGINHVVNAQTGKVIAKFEDKDSYCINGISEDEKITLNSCDSSILDSADEKDSYKLIVKGKVIDINDECDKVSVQYDTLVCVKDGEKYLLNKDYERSVSLEEDIAYIDGDTYAIEDDDNVLIYKNGEKVATIKDVYKLSTGKVYYDSYLIKHDDEKYAFYDLNGEKITNANYDYVYNFDINGLARVEHDREYFLINKEGKKVGGTYESIVNHDGDYYIVRNKDDKYGVINSKGEELLELEYESIVNYTVDLKNYLELVREDEHQLYSVDKKKVILDGKEDMSFTKYYVECEVDGDTQYFTYNGKMFYEK